MINRYKNLVLGHASGSSADEVPGSSTEVREIIKRFKEDLLRYDDSSEDEDIEVRGEVNESSKSTSAMKKLSQDDVQVKTVPLCRKLPGITTDKVFIALIVLLSILVIAFTIYVLTTDSPSCTFKWAGVGLCISAMGILLTILFYRCRDSIKLTDVNNTIDDNVQMKWKIEGANPRITGYKEKNYLLNKEIEKWQKIVVSQKEDIGKLNEKLSKYRQQT